MCYKYPRPVHVLTVAVSMNMQEDNIKIENLILHVSFHRGSAQH